LHGKHRGIVVLLNEEEIDASIALSLSMEGGSFAEVEVETKNTVDAQNSPDGSQWWCVSHRAPI
jgi:hypothetical protein